MFAKDPKTQAIDVVMYKYVHHFRPAQIKLKYFRNSSYLLLLVR